MMKKCFLILPVIILCLACNGIRLKNYREPLPSLLDDMGIDPLTIRILIDKSENKLSLVCDSGIIKEYPAVFGRNPKEDKLMQGDKCTPEGEFSIRAKYPHNKWSKFIWIDYPNQDSWQKHRKAKQEGKIPQDAAIGGEIGIHGVPGGCDRLVRWRFNWTLGCIAMQNEDVNEIYPYISEKTIIQIQK